MLIALVMLALLTLWFFSAAHRTAAAAPFAQLARRTPCYCSILSQKPQSRSAEALINYLSTMDDHVLKNSSVLELGSGCGAVGMPLGGACSLCLRVRAPPLGQTHCFSCTWLSAIVGEGHSLRTDIALMPIAYVCFQRLHPAFALRFTAMPKQFIIFD